MDCREAQPLLSPHLDSELDLLGSIELERHLRTCADCRRHSQQAKAARAAVREQATYFTAPDTLREKIAATLPIAKRKTATPIWFNFSAAFALLVIVIWSLYPNLPVARSDGRVADEVISGHVRALMANHLTDIASSDRHTVKPWFNGKIDFSPPISDLAAQGFPLIGGRLDYISNRAAAALVYRHDRHTINLFIWPAPAGESSPAKALERNGYNIVHWSTSGMEYWAVSDLNAMDLKNFSAILMKTEEAEARPSSIQR
ncbi:MAG: anti-sigma factor family protein [Candidatus Binatia bacterium]